MKINEFKILDCTFRDGGYYTNWDFSESIINDYFSTLNKLPIDYIEIGYLNKPHDGYRGLFFYCPLFILNKIKQISNKEIVLILDEKSIETDELFDLLKPYTSKVSMIRMTVAPNKIIEAKQKAKVIKQLGFLVAFNLMYLSDWLEDETMISQFKHIENEVDFLYLVDSFGAVFPFQLKNIINRIKAITDVNLGFHGHNNLELALINTLTAVEQGVKIVDSTILGMGRGSGNLKTELLLTVLSKSNSIDLDFNSLSRLLMSFNKLKDKYKWGTSFPYMIAGAYSIPQKQIMNWIVNKFYSINNIIGALKNQISKEHNKYHFKKFRESQKKQKCIIIGGGDTIKIHFLAIENYLNKNKDTVLIHSSSKHLKLFLKFSNEQIICLVGNEDERFLLNKNDIDSSFNLKFLLPPPPRELGTFIPKDFEDETYELDKINFIDNDAFSTHCSVAVQASINLKSAITFLLGFDGYENFNISDKEYELFKENEYIFENAIKYGVNLVSITPTKYSSIKKDSIYTKI